jgi:glycosyltransferase involved in cell wall biosynthesis
MNPPLRVLQIGPFPPPHGGVESNLVAIRTFLRSQGIPCAVINITRHRREDADEVYYPESAIGVVQLLRRLQYDILHLHIGGTLSNRILSLALVCTLRSTPKAVMTFHSGGFPSTPEGRAMGRNSYAGFVLRRFDGLIGVNAEIMSFFAHLGVSSKRMRLIEPHSFLAETKPADTLPQSLEEFFRAHDPVLISVSGLEPEYDVPIQIEAVGHIREKFPSAGLVILGSGRLEQEIRNRIRACPYGEHISLCGDVPHAVTLLAVSRARVMLRTTLYDGDAISVREGLHLGTPVIATDNGMRPAGVHLIPKSNLPALVSAIEERLAEPPAPKKICGVDDKNLRAVLDFYQELRGDTAQLAAESAALKRAAR